MCGRFANTNTIEDLVVKFNIDIDSANDLYISESYNISPTQYSPVIFEYKMQRKIEKMHWGLIPSWSKDKKFSSNMINARLESIKDKPSYKNLVNTNRCIVISSGYYEWTQSGEKKQPYYIYNDEKILPIAGLWTKWEDILSFTIITRNAHKSLKSIPTDFIHYTVLLIFRRIYRSNYIKTTPRISAKVPFIKGSIYGF